MRTPISTLLLNTLLLIPAATPVLAQGAATMPAPIGHLVDIGGRKLHINCTGRGSPTIVLVPGGGAYSFDFTLVQSRVDSATRSCSYDRAGMAWSDPGPADETVEQTVDDLHRLLRAAGEQPPYIMVGASIGGVFVRAYQHRFPAEVAALVFDNSAHRIGKFTPARSDLIWNLSEADIRGAYPLAESITKGSAPTAVGKPFDHLPEELQSIRLWFEVRRWDEWDRTKAGPAADLSWRREFLREFTERCSLAHPLGALPIVVVSDMSKAATDSARAPAPGSCPHEDAGAGLDALSSNSVYIHAIGSGHEIHLFQPETMVDAIRRAVGMVRR